MTEQALPARSHGLGLCFGRQPVTEQDFPARSHGLLPQFQSRHRI